MTVTYTDNVTSVKGFNPFLKLLFRWKGSIYKLIWKDLIVFLVLFYSINMMYRFGLTGNAKTNFEQFVKYCREYYKLIPLVFILGFYVSLVIGRFWEEFKTIPGPDSLAILIRAHVKDEGDEARLLRRTVVRYACLSLAITLSMMSPKVKKRFPTLDHFVNSGLMLDEEKRLYESLEKDFPGYTKQWVPMDWAANLITNARADGYINNDQAVSELLREINNFRGACGALTTFDWVNIPLAYTQVVTVTIYLYCSTIIVGRQFLDDEGDFYFPFITLLDYFFYVGWLKVAEALLNPFGDDDDDFETNFLIDRNIVTAYIIVDKKQEYPKMAKDPYWDLVAPSHLPHTEASEKCTETIPEPTTNSIKLKQDELEISNAPDKRMRFRRLRQAKDMNASKTTLDDVEMQDRRLLANDSYHSINIRNDSRRPTLASIDTFTDIESPTPARHNTTSDRTKDETKQQMQEHVRSCLDRWKANNYDEKVQNQLIDILINKNVQS